MKKKAVAVGAEDKRNIEGMAVVQSLLHACTQRMVVVLGLNDSNRTVRLVVENIVGPFDLLLVADGHVAANTNWAVREGFLLADLLHLVPACMFQCRRDKLGANVPFA